MRSPAFNYTAVYDKCFNNCVVVLFGRQAWRSLAFLALPNNVEMRLLPQLGRLGPINYWVHGVRVGADEAWRIF